MGKGRGSRRTETYDKELGDAVAKAQRGDETAFSAAYRTVHPPLLGYLRGLVGDDAEDVASDAWLEIARDLGRFRGDGAGFRAWTARIARNRAIDHLRRLKSRPRGTTLAGELAELPARQDTAEEALEIVTTRQALALIAELPRQQAEAVLLQTVIGLDGPAAARVLGKRQGAVRSATHRGLKRLEKRLLSLGRDRVTDSDSSPLGESR
ncbi:RNA polymerase sigma factor [Streptomyces sp. NPDC006283]|uniref:RNA polymerase sigma factor n=1 Tax=Streptomyces sp. NPDC006283 TaxID=3156741 RepID=UPI0033A3868D